MRPGARIDLVELELLVDVAETGSLGRAAARHGLSQPAVSMRMTGLERALGLRLLRRDPSGTELTSAGAEILTAARAVLAAVDRLGAAAERLRAESAGRLRVAASFTVAEHLLPAWIDTLRAGEPDLAVSLEVTNSSHVLDAVHRRRVDVGFVEGPEGSLPGLCSEVVATDELVVVAHPSHPWARRRRPLTGEDLAHHELVVRERGSGTREVLEAALEPWGGVRSRLELGSSAAILAATRRREGPAVLSRLAAAGDLAAGSLCSPTTTGVDLTRAIRAVWNAEDEPGTLVRRLLGVARPMPVNPGATTRGSSGKAPLSPKL